MPETFPEQHIFSRAIIFRRKILLAGISRRENVPERTSRLLIFLKKRDTTL